ncbi:glycosyltransferase [Nocardia brasiliensis]|uniref:glycosyltransferase n=1 Tax=Streptomyces sp. NPDC056056 TaxID=3345698 RepID=UPI0035DB120D
MLISVITPVWQPRADWLVDAYGSLISQQLPEGWEWEWMIQFDDEQGELPLPAAALADSRVKPGYGPHGGPGTARNLALERSAGAFIRNLDSDDTLTPTALADSINVLTTHPEVGWTTCRALDLLPDGSLTGFDADPAEGLLPRGYVFDWWQSHEYLLSVHPTTVCIRRELLIGIGGWMALPSAEDTGMLLVASVVAPGWFLSSVGLHYRQHPQQLTRSNLHAESKPVRRKFLVDRVQAVRALLEKSQVNGDC